MHVAMIWEQARSPTICKQVQTRLFSLLSSYPSFNNIPDEESENLKRRLFIKA
jgi:hypothetical protein